VTGYLFALLVLGALVLWAYLIVELIRWRHPPGSAELRRVQRLHRRRARRRYRSARPW
jgi:hypothetical protein